MYPYPNGPFGNMMPYSDFHGMNLDWVIQIAKDFLDQYTHIQEIIQTGETSITAKTAEGLDQLQAKATTLEGLLQAWYNTHSQDIANELVSALASFNEQATLIGSQIIASIPPDYDAYAQIVNDLSKLHKSTNIFNRPGALNGYYSSTGFVSNNSWKASPAYIEIGTETAATCHKTAGGAFLSYYDEDLQYISNAAFTDGNIDQTLTFPATAKYFHISMTNDAYTGGFTLAFGSVATTDTRYFDNYRLDGNAFIKNLYVVDPDPLYGDFSTIAEACAAAADNSIIYIKPGRYNEDLHLYGKTLTLIGEDPNRTVVYNYNYDREHPPLEISSGTVKNIGFESLNDGGTYPSVARPYAVHIDDDTAAGKSLTFENCRFYAQWNSAAGIGMRTGFSLAFKNCDFTTTSDTQSALFAHDSTSEALAGTYTMTVSNCTITAASSKSAEFQGIGYTGNLFRILLRNNSFYDDTNGHTDATIAYSDPSSMYPPSHGNKWLGSDTLVLNALSFGNNVPICNL